MINGLCGLPICHRQCYHDWLTAADKYAWQGEGTSTNPSHHLKSPINSRLHPIKPNQSFFVPLTTSPRTFVQSISASIFSSTSPQITTLSPRIKYSPCSICELGSGSSGVRMMRSIVFSKTRFVSWSVDSSVPINVRPSTVRMRIFSVVC